MQQNIKLAVFYAVIASFMNALTAALVKQAGPSLSTLVIIFARFSLGLVLLLIWLLWQKRGRLNAALFRTSNMKLHVLRAALGLSSFACFFYAIGHIPLVDAILLNVSNPLFVPFVVAIFLSIPFAHRLWPGIILGFMGVILVLEPGMEVFQINSLVGLASGILSAGAIVVTSRVNNTEPRYITLFYYYLFGSLILGMLLPFTDPALPAEMIGLLLLISLISVCYQALFITALQHAPARVVTPLFYLTIVFGGFFDWLGWGTIPPVHVCAGSLLVFTGATFTVLAGRQLTKAPRSPAKAS